MIVMDAGQDALSFGGANVDGAAFSLNNLTQRTHITSVGSQFHIPAQTTDFDNVSGTIAIGSAAFVGIPTWTNANATLTMTNSASLYIQGIPVDSTNVTATTAGYALWVDAGVTRLDGALRFEQTSEIETTGDHIFSIDADNDATNNAWRFFNNRTGGSGGTEIFNMSEGGILNINDTTANANMTIGLTINQGANDNEILALKSSDVTAPWTGTTEADTFGVLVKVGSTGGLWLRGFNDGASVQGMLMDGVSLDTSVDDTTTTSGTGMVQVRGLVDDDVTGIEGLAAAGLTGNLFVASDANLAQFIVKEDGEIFSNITANTYDDYDDVDLIRGFSQVVGKDIIKGKWDDFVSTNEQALVDVGILGAPLAEHPLYSITKLQMLHNGAIWQLYTQQRSMNERLEQRLMALEGPNGPSDS